MFGWLMTAAGIGAADLGAKHLVSKKMDNGEEKTVAGGNVVITRSENKGAVLGLMEERPELLRVLSSAALGASAAKLMDAVRHKEPKAKKLGLAMITGGALSNVGERLLRGRVTDYIRFPKAPKYVRNLTFNLADFAIFTGFFFTMLGEIIAAVRSGKQED